MQEILTCEEKKKKESSLLNQNKPHSPFTILKRSLIIPTRTYFGSMLLKKKKKSVHIQLKNATYTLKTNKLEMFKIAVFIYLQNAI